jgi:hypothetical protein
MSSYVDRRSGVQHVGVDELAYWGIWLHIPLPQTSNGMMRNHNASPLFFALSPRIASAYITGMTTMVPKACFDLEWKNNRGVRHLHRVYFRAGALYHLETERLAYYIYHACRDNSKAS